MLCNPKSYSQGRSLRYGIPPEELKQLARYMEHSVSENARTAGLARLHEMVTKVKKDREVGLAYMKAYEIEKRIREQEREETKAEERAEAIRIFILDKIEDQISKDKILLKLQKYYMLTEQTASEYYDKVIQEAEKQTQL